MNNWVTFNNVYEEVNSTFVNLKQVHTKEWAVLRLVHKGKLKGQEIPRDVDSDLLVCSLKFVSAVQLFLKKEQVLLYPASNVEHRDLFQYYFISLLIIDKS